MAYTRYRPDTLPPDWANDAIGGTPITAEALRHVELGLQAAAAAADAGVPKAIGTTAGDLVYWSASAVPARLPAGVAGTVLKGGVSPTFAQVGNADIDPAALINAVARSQVKKNGTLVGTRRGINLIEGTGVTLTMIDDAGGEEVDVTIASSGGGTNYRKTTEKDIVNTVTETDLLNDEITIAAGVMGTNNALLAMLLCDYLNNSAAVQTITLKVKFGATTVFHDVTDTIVAGATRRNLRINIEIANLGAANSQYMHGRVVLGSTDAATTGIGGIGTPAPTVDALIGSDGTVGVDTAIAQTFKVTLQHSAAHASLSARLKYGLIAIV